MDDDLKKFRDRDIIIIGQSELLFRENIESADSTDLSDLPELEIVPEDSEVYLPSSDQLRLGLFPEDRRLWNWKVLNLLPYLFIPSSASRQGDPLCKGIFPDEGLNLEELFVHNLYLNNNQNSIFLTSMEMNLEIQFQNHLICFA